MVFGFLGCFRCFGSLAGASRALCKDVLLCHGELLRPRLRGLYYAFSPLLYGLLSFVAEVSSGKRGLVNEMVMLLFVLYSPRRGLDWITDWTFDLIMTREGLRRTSTKSVAADVGPSSISSDTDMGLFDGLLTGEGDVRSTTFSLIFSLILGLHSPSSLE